MLKGAFWQNFCKLSLNSIGIIEKDPQFESMHAARFIDQDITKATV